MDALRYLNVCTRQVARIVGNPRWTMCRHDVVSLSRYHFGLLCHAPQGLSLFNRTTPLHHSAVFLTSNATMLNTRDYNALSLAQPTNFRGMLHSGEYLWGTGCRIAHPEGARIIATTPYHFCFIDAVRSIHPVYYCTMSERDDRNTLLSTQLF